MSFTRAEILAKLERQRENALIRKVYHELTDGLEQRINDLNDAGFISDEECDEITAILQESFARCYQATREADE